MCIIIIDIVYIEGECGVVHGLGICTNCRELRRIWSLYIIIILIGTIRMWSGKFGVVAVDVWREIVVLRMRGRMWCNMHEDTIMEGQYAYGVVCTYWCARAHVGRREINKMHVAICMCMHDVVFFNVIYTLTPCATQLIMIYIRGFRGQKGHNL